MFGAETMTNKGGQWVVKGGALTNCGSRGQKVRKKEKKKDKSEKSMKAENAKPSRNQINDENENQKTGEYKQRRVYSRVGEGPRPRWAEPWRQETYMDIRQKTEPTTPKQRGTRWTCKEKMQNRDTELGYMVDGLWTGLVVEAVKTR